MLLSKLSIILTVLLLVPACGPKAKTPPTIVKVPVVVTPPSCIARVGDPPAPPATDAAPAPAVDVDAARALIARTRRDGDQPGDVAVVAAIAEAALARIVDDEDPGWMAYRVAREAWVASVARACR